MAYEDAVQLPNGAWFDITAFRARVIALNTSAPASTPGDGRIRLASGQTFDVENLVARLAVSDGMPNVVDILGLHGLRLPNGSVYDALDLNRRIVAKDGGATCFLPRLQRTVLPFADTVKISGVSDGTGPSVLNLTGAAARVAITDATYWISTGGTLARTTDAAYEANLKASSSNKSIPFPQNQPIPAGSIGYVILRIPATTADSPPIFVNWEGAAAQPSAASPMLPTVFVNTDLSASVTSPNAASWVQDTANLLLFRPSATSDSAYQSRGGRFFIDSVGPAREIMVKFDLTNASITQSVLPHICCSSGQWMVWGGMSIIRNQISTISGISGYRATIQGIVSGSDPFFFVTARSGANQQAIIDEQVTPFSQTPQMRKFVRGIFMNGWINDLAFVGSSVRPYSTATQTVRDGIGQRATAILSTLKGLGVTLVGSDCTYGNYGAATPAVNGDLSSANGNLPWITNVLGPVHKAQVPACFDAAYDWPVVSQYAAMGNTFETDMGDEVHPNGVGYTAFRANEAGDIRLLYGLSAGPNTMQRIITALGSSTTTAKKTRAQAVFDALVAGYPTVDSAAQTNRASLRAQLDALTAT